MKKIFYTCFILFFTIVIQAQVGINTQNPLGVFHVDPVSTTTTDDVLVNESGMLGIGTTNPQAKVHIKVAKGEKVLRMVDGNQKNDRALVSDAAGNAGWGVIKSSGGEVKKIAVRTYPNRVRTKLYLEGTNTKYKVGASGNIMVFIRWWGTTTAITSNKSVNGYFGIYKNGVRVEEIEYYTTLLNKGAPFNMSTILVATNCLKGDYLEIDVYPISGVWTTYNTAHTIPSLTFFMM